MDKLSGPDVIFHFRVALRRKSHFQVGLMRKLQFYAGLKRNKYFWLVLYQNHIWATLRRKLNSNVALCNKSHFQVCITFVCFKEFVFSCGFEF